MVPIRQYCQKAVVSVVVLAAAVLILSFFPTRVSADGPAVRLPTSPVSVALLNPGSSSYFTTTLAGVGTGRDVADAMPYLGWCIEDNGAFNTSITARLYSSYDPHLPSSLTKYAPGKPVPWNQVNYVLNHKNDYPNANWRHIQVAIWTLTWGGYRGGDTPPSDQAIVDQIVNDAAANGANYIPGPGKIMAVILYTDGLGPNGVQDSIIEVTVPQPATLGDFVWVDKNANGIQDTGEPGMPNVTVKLYDCATNALLRSTTTDASGHYRFTNLAPGSYYVAFVLPSGFTFSPSGQGSNRAKDSDAQCAPKSGQKPDNTDGCDDSSKSGDDHSKSSDDRSKSSDDRSKSSDDRSKNSDDRSKNSDDRSKSSDDRSKGCDDHSNSGDDRSNSCDGSSKGGDYGSRNGDAQCTGRTACITLASGQTNNDVDAGMVPCSGTNSDRRGGSDRKESGDHKDSSKRSTSDCSDSKKS